MNKIFFVFLLLLGLCSSSVNGQEYFTIRANKQSLKIGESIGNSGITIIDHIPGTGLYKVKVSEKSRIDAAFILTRVAGIDYVSKVKTVELRNKIPNDPELESQWQYDLVNATDAWVYGTGGVTITGDTIVMAVMDAGFDSTNLEMIPNYWHNRYDIPNDGIDNDGNGYIDDFNGLNSDTNTDNHLRNSHGLKVAGIMGAKGDNGIGGTGINWSSKIMQVSYIPDDFAVVKGLRYILDQRRRYNASNGNQGAFVVSVNNSFGITGEFPDDGHEIWCNTYDSLGLAGVLIAGATTNSNDNIDVLGDIPSTCPSNYLITVTNVNQQDTKEFSAGYGVKNVDLGAPGENTWTIGLNNTSGKFSGTSAATPHIAGLIGLLYSTQCESLMQLAKADPAAAATKVRTWILNGVVSNESLKGKTVTGGRTDFKLAMEQLIKECGNPLGNPDETQFELLLNNRQLIVKPSTAAYGVYTLRVTAMNGISYFTQGFVNDAFSKPTVVIDLSLYPIGAYVLSISQGDAKPWSRVFPVLK